MPWRELFEILATSLEIAFTIKITLQRSRSSRLRRWVCHFRSPLPPKTTLFTRGQSKWDPKNLHRHPDYAPIQKESVENRPKKIEYTQMKTEASAGPEDTRPNDTSIISNLYYRIYCHEFSTKDYKFRPKASKTNSAVCEPVFCLQSSVLIVAGDEFDEADFSVTHHEHPDEVSLDAPTSSEDLQRPNTYLKRDEMTGPQIAQNRNAQHMRPPAARTNTTGPEIPSKPQPFPRGRDSNSSAVTRPGGFKIMGQKQNDPLIPQQQGRTSDNWQSARSLTASRNTALVIVEVAKPAPSSVDERGNPQPTNPIPNNTPPPIKFSDNVEHDPPIRFFTARAAESVQNVSGMPLKAPAFNPHLESPSIRKTAGVDHTKTKPVEKEAIGVASPASLPPRLNFVNPQADRARRVGMPVGAASPLQNRNSYKPPQMKRTVEMNMAQWVSPLFLMPLGLDTEDCV